MVAAAGSNASAVSAAASAATGDADVPGWLGDPGDGRMSASTSAASASAGAGTRLRRQEPKRTGPGEIPGRFFLRSGLAVLPGGVSDIAVNAALVAEKGRGEEAAAKQDGEKDAEHGRNDGVHRQGASLVKVEKGAGDHQNGRQHNPLQNADEFRFGLVAIGRHAGDIGATAGD